MAKKMINLNGLNPQQKEAVETIDGVCQVNSVAGSGKTKVLTNRIAYMIQNKNINPENILVTTFTKKAAEEMIERLGTIITKKDLKELTIGTFHSIGYRILKSEYRLMNHPLKNFELLQGNPLKWLVAECLKDLNIKTTDTYNEGVFAAAINDLKMNNFSPESCLAKFLTNEITDHERNVMRVYDLYETKKDKRNLIDFNDMLYKTYYLFMENPKILKKYQDKFQYVLVDESQDNNMCQYDLIKMLAEPQNNIFIVGDDDQSVYKFRGARPDQFITFKDEFETKIINMETNYRSLPYILKTANNIIKHNTVRVIKELKPSRKVENAAIEIPYVAYTNNEDEEAAIVAEKIHTLSESGKSYSDMAVIYRTNAQSRAIEDQMIKNGIPYIVFSGISFYERAEVKDLVAYLKLAVNIKDDESFKRIINKPSRYLGKKFLDELQQIANRKRISLYEALYYIQSNYSQKTNITKFKMIIQLAQEVIDTTNVGALIAGIRKNSGYDEYLIKENGNEEDNVKLDNVNSLQQSASKFTSVENFIKYVDLIASAKVDENVPAVKLLTIHKSKGLEFPVVFMIGMSEGLLPHNYALEESEEAIEEERRLAYVGVTRAQDYLFVTSPAMYNGKMMNESRFLAEGEFVPEESEVAK